VQVQRACIVYQYVERGAQTPDVLSQPPHLGQAGQVTGNGLDSGFALRQFPDGIRRCGRLGLGPAQTVKQLALSTLF